MHYIQYILRRLLYSLVVLLGLSIIIFFLARILPGEPARMALGPFASEEQVMELRAEMGLDKSLPEQYVRYLSNIFRGDFGRSLVSERNVILDIRYYFPATLELIIFTLFWVIIIGIPLGVISAVNQRTTLDGAIKAFSFAAVVTPGFIIGITFQLIFGYVLNVMPITGRLSPMLDPPARVTGMLVIDSILSGNSATLMSALQHLMLPSLALSAAGIGQVLRITRSSMIETEGKDFITVMRSYGVPDNIINFRYMLKPSFIPTLNVAGLTFASLFGNAFLIEMVFSWSGMAKYGINSLLKKDINALVGVVLIIGVIFLLTNLIIDVAMGIFDPRIRLGGRGGESE